jgi:hypothetical protein
MDAWLQLALCCSALPAEFCWSSARVAFNFLVDVMIELGGGVQLASLSRGLEFSPLILRLRRRH